MSSDERKKLVTLLDYWIEHNVEHGQEFREWAEKAASFGEPEVGKEIKKAADVMDVATGQLVRVKQKLAGKEG